MKKTVSPKYYKPLNWGWTRRNWEEMICFPGNTGLWKTSRHHRTGNLDFPTVLQGIIIGWSVQIVTVGIKCQLFRTQKASGGFARELLKVFGSHLTGNYESRLEQDLYCWCSLFKGTRGDKSKQKPTFLFLMLILLKLFFIVSVS